MGKAKSAREKSRIGEENRGRCGLCQQRAADGVVFGESAVQACSKCAPPVEPEPAG
jgi:hypothetical protein